MQERKYCEQRCRKLLLPRNLGKRKKEAAEEIAVGCLGQTRTVTEQTPTRPLYFFCLFFSALHHSRQLHSVNRAILRARQECAVSYAAVFFLFFTIPKTIYAVEENCTIRCMTLRGDTVLGTLHEEYMLVCNIFYFISTCFYLCTCREIKQRSLSRPCLPAQNMSFHMPGMCTKQKKKSSRPKLSSYMAWAQ